MTPVTVLAAWLAGPAAARALTPNEAQARDELVREAQRAHRDGNHTRSLELYQKAAALETTPSLLYWTVWEQQEMGLIADAYLGAERCLKELARNPTIRNAKQIRAGCQALDDQLREKVGRIEVNVPAPQPEGLTVKLSGHELNHAMIGVPYTITPGRVLVEAEAPGHAPFRLEIDVPEGKTVNVAVTLAEATAAKAEPGHCPDGAPRSASGVCGPESCEVGMERTEDGAHCCWPGQVWDTVNRECGGAPRCPAGTSANGATCIGGSQLPGIGSRSGPAEGTSAVAASGPRRRPFLSTPTIAVGAAGGAVLVTSGIVWLVSNGRFDSLKSLCDGGCTVSDRRAKVDDIKRLDAWALGLAIGGGALVATAAVLEWRGRSDDAPAVQVGFDPSSRTALLGGRF